MKKNQGLTLIELMVVVLIIALLITVGVVAMKNARAKARDAKRVYDITQYAKAARLYADENGGQFPVESGYLGRSGQTNDDLKKYLPMLPPDPQDDGGTRTDSKYYYYVAANSCQGEVWPTVHVQNVETANEDYYNNPCAEGSVEGNANFADYLIIIR